MIEIKNKFAIGCLIQWYEIEIIKDYLLSVQKAVDNVKNKENIIIDLYFNCDQSLEKIDEQEITISEIKQRYYKMLEDIFGYNYDFNDFSCYSVNLHINEFSNKIYTIADYRREFNDKYCDNVDVLMWGESDSLIPTQTFEILDGLHSQVKNQTPKYVGFFSTCKMWDDSWKVIEHPDFTDKPFIEGDTENWWSLRYTMNQEEMEKINDKTTDLDVQVVNPYKFNGCGLVISSEVIKAGVNIPKSVFFIHEDTAFMNVMQKILGGSVPQYLIKNILLVHNRKHPDKRMYIDKEQGIDKTDPGAQRGVHDWYKKANKMCEHNAYNLFNQNRVFTWEDVFE